MKLNRSGLKLSATYVAYFIVLSGLAVYSYVAGGDPKGGAFLMALAYLPVGLVFALSGLMYLMERYIPVDSWINGPFFLFPVSLVIVYLSGCAFGAFRRLSKELNPAEPVGEDTPDWHKR